MNELTIFLAEFIIQGIEQNNDKYTIALSGGKTPELIFDYLAEFYNSKINWSKTNIFWGDERCVPPEDPESNYKMAKEHLLSKISIPEKNVFRIAGEAEPELEAIRYSGILKNNLYQKNNIPCFDLILLGLGEDGHTASIFPDQMNLIESDKICSAAVHSKSNQQRITLTAKTINNSKSILFIAVGKSKSMVVSEIINSNKSAKKYPAFYIKPSFGKLIWLVDKQAALLL